MRSLELAQLAQLASNLAILLVYLVYRCTYFIIDIYSLSGGGEHCDSVFLQNYSTIVLLWYTSDTDNLPGVPLVTSFCSSHHTLAHHIIGGRTGRAINTVPR